MTPASADPNAKLLQVNGVARSFIDTLPPEERRAAWRQLHALKHEPSGPPGWHVYIQPIDQPDTDEAIMIGEMPGHLVAGFVVKIDERQNNAQKVVVKWLGRNRL